VRGSAGRTEVMTEDIPMDWATALATLLLVAVGGYQIAAIRKENRMDRTLGACNRYESDLVIERCVRRLRQANSNGHYDKNPKAFEHDVTIVLNYLDSIAIGIQQGLYDEELARDHTETIVKHYYDRYLTDAGAKKAGTLQKDYGRLCAMAQEWSKTHSYFRKAWTWWRLT
jgi:hypothetical protein